MIYTIRHVTRYTYAARAEEAQLALRVTPRSDDGQACLYNTLSILPRPRATSTEHDFFGNIVTTVVIDAGLTALTVEARSRLDVARPAALWRAASPPWESVARAALEEMSIAADAPAHFLFPSRRIALAPDISAYAAKAFPPQRPILEGARALMTQIHDDFDYKPQSTDLQTPLATAFARRQGVCQDFAQIMIAGLRGLGLPAAYVSGYIRTVTPPGAKRLEGADATHAWVSVWCGPEIGWYGLDPTNAMDIGDDHIVLAIGRDFSDVSPIYGVFLGSGAQALEVGVDVIPA